MQILSQIFGAELPSESVPIGVEIRGGDTPEEAAYFSLNFGNPQEEKSALGSQIQPLAVRGQTTIEGTEKSVLSGTARDDASSAKTPTRVESPQWLAMTQDTSGLLDQRATTPLKQIPESARGNMLGIDSDSLSQDPRLIKSEMSQKETLGPSEINMVRSADTKANILNRAVNDERTRADGAQGVSPLTKRQTPADPKLAQQSIQTPTAPVSAKSEQLSQGWSNSAITTSPVSIERPDASSDLFLAVPSKPISRAPASSESSPVQARAIAEQTASRVFPQTEPKSGNARDTIDGVKRESPPEPRFTPSWGAKTSEQTEPPTRGLMSLSRQATSTPVEISYRSGVADDAQINKTTNVPSEKRMPNTPSELLRAQAPTISPAQNPMASMLELATRTDQVRQTDLGSPAAQSTLAAPVGEEVIVAAATQKPLHPIRDARMRSEQERQTDLTAPKQAGPSTTTAQQAPISLSAKSAIPIPPPFVAFGFDAPPSVDALQTRDLVFHELSEGSDTKTELNTQSKTETVARPIVHQLVQAAKTAGDGTIEIRLSPEELGRVRLSLTPSDANITVHISAERPETADLIRRNIDLLSASLKQEGFTNLEFSFGERGSDQTERQTKETASLASDEVIPTEITPVPDKRPQTFVAGRLDIRI